MDIHIKALTNEGIFDQSEMFHPGDPLTRAQMAKILVQSFELKANSKNHFKDVTREHWAYDDIQTLVGAGITTGTSNTTFSPYQTVTRVQMAAFVNRTLHFLDKPMDIKPAKDEKTFTDRADEVFVLTNKERTKRGIPALKRNKDIEKLAMLKAQDLYDNNYFDHKSPVYGRAFDMMKKEDISYHYAGENIAYGFSSAEDVVEAWMNSPSHRKNILNKRFKDIGIGYYQPVAGKKSDKKIVQMFIDPK